MVAFFFHLRDRAGLLIDEEGRDFPDASAALAAGRQIARELVGTDVSCGSFDLMQSLVLSDESGTMVGEIPFAQALVFSHAGDAVRARRWLTLLGDVAAIGKHDALPILKASAPDERASQCATS